MKLTDVLLILFTGGCWLYCLTDAAMTPASAFRGLSKRAWIRIIAATFFVGAIMWLLVQSRCRRPWARATVADWPGRYRNAGGRPLVVGPDDDEEFLRHLARIISDSRG